MSTTFEELIEETYGKETSELSSKIIDGTLTESDIRDLISKDATAIQQLEISAHLDTIVNILVSARIISAEDYTEIFNKKRDSAIEVTAHTQYNLLMGLADQLKELKDEYEDPMYDDPTDVRYEA